MTWPDCGCQKQTVSGTSDYQLSSGAVIETHSLVTYQSLGEARGLMLRYDSQTADPRPILQFGVERIPLWMSTRRSDVSIMASVSIARVHEDLTSPIGRRFETVLGGRFGNPDSFSHYWKMPEQGKGFRAPIQVDLSGQPTGQYLYQVHSQYRVLAGGAGSTITRRLIHRNDINSSFGAGWGLVGLQRLIPDGDRSVLLIDPSGLARRFEHVSPTVLEGPSWDFSRLELLPDGTYRRVMKDQTVYEFDSENRLSVIRDRNGNETYYTYDDIGNIEGIVDPVGLVTRFRYENDRVSEIIDPVGRTTRLDYDSNGNLQRITDPDGTSTNVCLR